MPRKNAEILAITTTLALHRVNLDTSTMYYKCFGTKVMDNVILLVLGILCRDDCSVHTCTRDAHIRPQQTCRRPYQIHLTRRTFEHLIMVFTFCMVILSRSRQSTPFDFSLKHWLKHYVTKFGLYHCSNGSTVYVLSCT